MILVFFRRSWTLSIKQDNMHVTILYKNRLTPYPNALCTALSRITSLKAVPLKHLIAQQQVEHITLASSLISSKRDNTKFSFNTSKNIQALFMDFILLEILRYTDQLHGCLVKLITLRILRLQHVFLNWLTRAAKLFVVGLVHGLRCHELFFIIVIVAQSFVLRVSILLMLREFTWF